MSEACKARINTRVNLVSWVLAADLRVRLCSKLDMKVLTRHEKELGGKGENLWRWLGFTFILFSEAR